MARRKKPSDAAPMQTRRSRRATVLPASADDTTSAETSLPTSVDDQQTGIASDPPEPAASTSRVQDELPKTQASLTDTSPAPVQIVALHKKFGKYRLLLNDESYSRRSEVSGSDSESGSVEIRVVDPTVSSESDSNVLPIEEQSDDMSARTSSPTISHVTTFDSNVSSPALSLRGREEDGLAVENDTVCSVDRSAHFHPPTDADVSNEGSEICASELQDISTLYEHEDKQNGDGEEGHGLSDDDVITVVQIVEEDSAEVYYNINMDSPSDRNAFHDVPDLSVDVSCNSEPINKFHQNFENLNLSDLQQPNSLMETNEFADVSDVNLSSGSCSAINIQSPLEQSNEMIRPDASFTPNSMSDDSNSSRLPECQQTNSNDSSESSSGVRRSSRIKTISSLKQKTKGYGLVKTPLKKALIAQTKMKLDELSAEGSPLSTSSAPQSPSFTVPTLDMPVKVKSRWRRSSEMEMIINSPVNSPLASPNVPSRLAAVNENSLSEEKESDVELKISASESEKVIQDRMNQFLHLNENEYQCERAISKEAKKMTCDCFLTKEEVERGEMGCGEDCLNRLLMIECNYRCPVGERCTNRRFQKCENAHLKVFYADKKGCGLEAAVDITPGEFLMEYVGEVLDSDQFYKRAQEYSDDNNLHHYFMSLKGDTVIDATMKGNISRFINHSCEPNAETQKWTVNGELRIGFFSKRDIVKGEEITFDYQFQRFGKEAQRCYCGAGNCRGWIGAEPDSDEEEEDDEEEDVSTSKTESELKGASHEVCKETSVTLTADAKETKAEKKKKKKKERRNNYAIRPKAELVLDADIEDDIEALSRTGIKNQSHTLTLSRTMVRAKTRRSQAALLRLLREADLPCRRLFLDYRGLRLLAPWCANTTFSFRLEMLQTLDRLPVPNKTMVQESRLFTAVERWLAEAEAAGSAAEPLVCIDEATGLPVDINIKRSEPPATTEDSLKESPAVKQKLSDLSKQLLERWSSLKEVFKIPKKERIQQMKEHERQANVERRAADSSGARDRDRERYAGRDRDRPDRDRDRERERDKEREKERYRERDRDREKERDRERDKDRDRDDRDRRKRRGGSPDGRRSIRLEERVLAAIPPMSKEERRRAFAEAAEAAERTKQAPSWPQYPWPHGDVFPQMFPQGMLGGPPGLVPPSMLAPGMVPPSMLGAPPMLGLMGPGDVPPEWVGPNGEYMGPPQFAPMPFGAPPPFCLPQPNFMGMPGYPLGYMFPPGAAPPPFSAPPPTLTQPPQAAPNVMPENPPQQASVIDERWKGLLPSGWRSATDDRGRMYYYHVKNRIPQWVPPTPPPPPSDDEATSEEEDQSPPEAVQDTRKVVEGRRGIYRIIKEDPTASGLIPEQALLSCRPRKRRPGLVTERPISPRSEQDKLAGKLQVKRYKETKEKLRRRKEKQERLRRRTGLINAGKVDLASSDSETEAEERRQAEAEDALETEEEALVISGKRKDLDSEDTTRRLKEMFRSSMARVMVTHLNQYRRQDATRGRITNTADFKHLARKLTHFVMLKELKHCRSVVELECNDSVKQKAKEFVRKYMSKFGPVYQRPAEEMD